MCPLTFVVISEIKGPPWEIMTTDYQNNVTLLYTDYKFKNFWTLKNERSTESFALLYFLIQGGIRGRNPCPFTAAHAFLKN